MNSSTLLVVATGAALCLPAASVALAQHSPAQMLSSHIGAGGAYIQPARSRGPSRSGGHPGYGSGYRRPSNHRPHYGPPTHHSRPSYNHRRPYRQSPSYYGHDYRGYYGHRHFHGPTCGHPGYGYDSYNGGHLSGHLSFGGHGDHAGISLSIPLHSSDAGYGYDNGYYCPGHGYHTPSRLRFYHHVKDSHGIPWNTAQRHMRRQAGGTLTVFYESD